MKWHPIVERRVRIRNEQSDSDIIVKVTQKDTGESDTDENKARTPQAETSVPTIDTDTSKEVFWRVMVQNECNYNLPLFHKAATS